MSIQNLRLSRIFLFFLFVLPALLGCRRDQPATALSPEVRAYVYAYTSGVISRVNPIKVQFTRPVAGAEEIGKALPANLIRFSPAIAGNATWEDERTLRFDPDEPLASGATYTATVNLKRIISDAPASAASFQFDFQTRGQFYEVELDGMFAVSPADLSKQQLRGQLYTADFADNDQVEKVLSATQNGRPLEIAWNHSADQQQHVFTVNNIARTEKASLVTVSYNGKPLAVDLRDEHTLEVPALGDFKVMDARVSYDPSPSVTVLFSDPLQESQQLAGLISIQGFDGQLRYLIDGQQVRIFPEQRLVGEARLLFNPGIRNSQGRRMSLVSEWTLTFHDVKPQVRLVGRGVIMPESEGLIFPFEAIGLNAVDVEIFKIFNNNILQFLQNNQLDGSYDLQEVGRIVLQKKVDLRQLNPGAGSGEWTRYALDLGKLLRQDPDAIYQVRIGFRPAYATYACPGRPAAAAAADELEPAGAVAGDDAEPESIMDNWYGFGGYYQGYEWEHREDPCYPAYYNSDRFVARNILSSNLGLIAKGGDGNFFFVVATDLRTAQPAGGATIEFYDYQQQLISSAPTDGKGIAQATLSRKPFVVVARQGNQKGYLRLQDGDALSVSQFDVAGAVTQRGLKGFLYAERGVWRPGDSVFLNFVLDDRYGKLPANYPITFELTDPRGALQERRATSANVGNVYPLHFVTGPDAPTGNWIARVKAGGASFERIVKIETVKPNRLSIDLDFGAEALAAGDEPTAGKLLVKWLHGAPARGIRSRVEVELKAGATTFTKFPDYRFDDPARQADYQTRTLFDGPLDGNGQASFRSAVFSGEQAPGRLTATFTTRAFEPGGEFSTDYRSLPYNPFDSYAGLRLPENSYGEPAVGVDENALIDVAAVDVNGNPLRNRRLSIGVYRVDWRWWWEQGYDEVARFSSSNHINALGEPAAVTTNAEGRAGFRTSFDQWGRYLVRVCDAESGHCSGDFLYVGSPGYGDDARSRQAAAMLNFRTDKETYAVGETVTLSVPGGQQGRALITLENGTKVIQSFWIDTREGDNTFTFKASAEMTPTVYAHVALLQPHGQVRNDLPLRLYGVLPVTVEDPATRLAPQLKLPDQLEPEQTFTVEVSEKAGKAMAYTLAVVDEGLLSLTRFKTPNPHDVFYAREALGVHTWDVYDQVLGAFGGQLERILAIGGDAAVDPSAMNQRANRFEPVVRHLGPFTLKKGQRARHQVTLPNYVGSVRVMAVAVAEGAYGAVEKQAPVKQPLMVLATLPRVLSPGERLELPVNVFAMDQKVRDVSVQVEEKSGLIRWEGPSSRRLSFAKPGEDLTAFTFTVAGQTGVARFNVQASSGAVRASQTIEIEVRNPNPVQTDAYAAVLEGSREWSQSFAAAGMPGTNSAILEVSNLPPLNLGQRLEFLLTYPYGCVEQTVSAGFPQLYVHRLLQLDENQKKRAADNVRATIDRLRQFQTDQGGFGYWPGANEVDQWSTTYAGHFLLEAQNQGYTLPPGMLSRWTTFQKKAARLWSPRLGEYGYGDVRSNQLNQAYRLYALALAKSPDMAAMNRLRETDDLHSTARWRLAAAYAIAGQGEVARTLVQNAPTSVDKYRDLGYTFGSDVRDRAMIMETLLLMGDEKRAAQILQYLSDELAASQWLSTQSVAYALLAVSRYVGDSEVSDSFQFAYQVNGGKTVNAGSSNPVMQIDVPVRAGAGNSVRVKNNGQAKLFARLIVQGRPLPGQESAGASDLRIAVGYFTADGKPLDPGRLTQGADFIAQVRVVHPGARPMPYRELALSQVFPSGWEILGTRLAGQGDQFSNSPYDYQDIRDDRVNTFFDLPEGQSRVYQVRLNAAYAGRFYLPAAACEAMYDNSIYAREGGRWVEVVREEGI